MTRTDLRTYTPEFRAEAFEVILELGVSLEATALGLSLPKGTLANWVKAARHGSMTPTSPPSTTVVITNF
ncbi:transposase [Noviherbaspirillum suwonense]|uniref:Transposase n=1 Tax=Noviherbaspirillum suwonense TaxID=1224511 RepID=A0ABY1QRB8_9BURK|nr:Transposase [Noviherbaspirillum suwonense]